MKAKRKAGAVRRIERGTLSRPATGSLSPDQRRKALDALQCATVDVKRGAAIPQYLLKALDRYADALDDHRSKVVVRTMVVKAADAGAYLTRDPPVGKASAFALVAKKLADPERWSERQVEAAYRNPAKK